MRDRIPYLKAPYRAYDYRVVPPPDLELTQVGPGTPAGEYLRRFWQPVAFLHELEDVPKRIRILGEELVLFRDLSARVGLLQLHCSHRGTSLEYARLQQRGLRCCYHGWLFDIDGRVLETPGAPAESALKDPYYHGAYPTREHKGLVFAYMGPPERKPGFPVYDVFDLPGYRTVPGRKHFIPANWLQMKENSMDPWHVVFLHTRSSGAQFDPNRGFDTEIDWFDTPLGMLTTSARRIGDNVWVRIFDFMLPNVHQFGPTWEQGRVPKIEHRPQHTIWTVPVDDTRTMNISLMPLSEEEARDPERVEFIRESVGQTERPYPEAQRYPSDYEAQTSQRPIAVHALERLAATDRGVMMLRNKIREGIAAVKRGEDPAGVLRESNGPLFTYNWDIILHMPKTGTEAEDRALLRETARRAVEGEYFPRQAALAGARS